LSLQKDVVFQIVHTPGKPDVQFCLQSPMVNCPKNAMGII